MTRVGVAVVTVTAGPVALPESTVITGGVIVAVVIRVTATVAVEVGAMTVLVILAKN